MLNEKFWRGKRVFLTGHSGFKGGWTVCWLHQLGAEVLGYSLQPNTTPNLFSLAKVSEKCASSNFADIRNRAHLESCIRDFAPDVVLHYAAQPLVGLSYEEPVETFDINVMGTINLLEAVRKLPAETVCIIVTSDKCYENPNDGRPLAEHAPLGGADPYSASKGACEVAVSSWIRSFFSDPNTPRVATARAGNVIGGGDWADRRLLPDAMRAFAAGHPLVLRNPTATRPWQHVLEPISGYLLMAERLVEDRNLPKHFNFGPKPEEVIMVREVSDIAVAHWGEPARWEPAESRQYWKEAHELVLDISLAGDILGWKPRLTTRQAVQWTIDWQRAYLNDPATLPEICKRQIKSYADAR